MACTGFTWSAGAVLLAVAMPLSVFSASDLSDADLVFCLSPGQRSQLIDAAVALQLAHRTPEPERLLIRDEGELTVEQWRRTHAADFDRACAALIAAARTAPPSPTPATPSPGNPDSLLRILLPVVVGALMTGVTTVLVSAWKDAPVRRRALAESLRSTALDFVQATDTYLRAWTVGTGDPEEAQTAVRRSLFTLQSVTRRIADEYPRWTLPGTLRKLVSTGELGDQLTERWREDDLSKRTRRASRIRDQLNHVHVTANQLAQALELPRAPRALSLRRASRNRVEV